MASVRISGNWRNPSKMEWAGAPEILEDGTLDRLIPELPDEVYQAIERSIGRGDSEGHIQLADKTRIQWVLDR